MRVNQFLLAARRTTLSQLGTAASGGNVKSIPKSPETPKGGDMLRYILSKMAQYPEAVVLTQVGSFYEMYFEHAIEYGPKLNLKIAKKKQQSPRTDHPFVNMAGFPSYQLEKYVKSLVQTYGKTVVLLEQDAKRIAASDSEAEKRPVTRVLTPGTLIAESFVDPWRNNYLVAIQFTSAHLGHLGGTGSKKSPKKKLPEISSSSPVGLAWVDLATGSFQFQETTFGSLATDLSRIDPNEILLDNQAFRLVSDAPSYFETLDLARYHLTRFKFPGKDIFPTLAHHIAQTESALKFTADNMEDRALQACAALMSYVDENLPGANLKFQPPQEFYPESVLQIDSRSRTGLELFSAGARDSVRGSLLSVIRRTVTPSGSRNLQEWLSSPLQCPELINERLDRVNLFLENPKLCNDLVTMLKSQADGKRIIQRLGLRKLDPMDVLGFAQCVENMIKIQALLEGSREKSLTSLAIGLKNHLNEPVKLAKKILKIIDVGKLIVLETNESDPEASFLDAQKGNHTLITGSQYRYDPVLIPRASKKLTDLYRSQELFPEKCQQIVDRIQRHYGDAVKASLRWTPAFSYHILLKLTKSIELPHDQILNRTKKTASIWDSELTELGLEREEFYTRLESIETSILESMRNKILEFTESTRAAAEIIDLLDTTQSMATLAEEKGLVRPQLTSEPILNIKGGRHLVVESGLNISNKQFEKNDCVLDRSRPMCMVTGPNMGGKSTYIRQNALICLLGHIGSYVPAEEALIGIVDKIFCRIGAGDDLFRGRSTFMMEMLETSAILTHATAKSVAILDEVGRGTSGKDGIAIAYATVKHLLEKTGCRTLFATHFGRDLLSVLEKRDLDGAIGCLQSAIREDGSDIAFDYKLKSGVAKDSHGLLIAEMANFPKEVLVDARSLLNGDTPYASE